MSAADIREKIVAATAAERQTGDLRRQLTAKLPELRQTLVLKGDNPVDALMEFVTGYIESVPGSISLVAAVSKRLGFHDYADPFLQMAQDYFLDPPEDVTGETGLAPLLDEAFLAHRLLEEVNDQHIRHLHRPLLPLDLTEANIIVHHLLGDTVAVRLEKLVDLTTARIFHKQYVWERIQSLQGTYQPPDGMLTTDTLTDHPGRVKLRLAS
jgi:hypothetical protein